jgi:hypothetical protein
MEKKALTYTLEIERHDDGLWGAEIGLVYHAAGA